MEDFMKKLLFVSLLVFFLSCAYGADFKGMCVGDYMSYYPETKVQYAEPFFLFWKAPGDLGFQLKVQITDITKSKGFVKILEQAESIAKSKGYSNFAISHLQFFPNVLYGDFLFW
jgi:hypothetical protein